MTTFFQESQQVKLAVGPTLMANVLLLQALWSTLRQQFWLHTPESAPHRGYSSCEANLRGPGINVGHAGADRDEYPVVYDALRIPVTAKRDSQTCLADSSTVTDHTKLWEAYGDGV